jgi:hypothetical protein
VKSKGKQAQKQPGAKMTANYKTVEFSLKNFSTNSQRMADGFVLVAPKLRFCWLVLINK